MKLVAISLGSPQTIIHRNKPVQTGIYKSPVDGTVHATLTGLQGDIQIDLKNHGGPDKAIYAYSTDNYRYWETELGRELPYGQFGENLAVTGLTDDTVHLGDIFEIGAIRVQVTQPRVPCFKLGIRMEDPSFVGRFHHSGRVGFYLRVLQEGEIMTGDEIRLIESDPRAVNLQVAMTALTPSFSQADTIRKVLAVPALSEAWREDLEKRLNRR